MAKIYGIELKNIKNFVGHEGLAFQANVYLNGKKVGFYSQDGWAVPVGLKPTKRIAKELWIRLINTTKITRKLII